MKSTLSLVMLTGLLLFGAVARGADGAPFKVAAVEFNPQLFEFHQNIPPLSVDTWLRSVDLG